MNDKTDGWILDGAMTDLSCEMSFAKSGGEESCVYVWVGFHRQFSLGQCRLNAESIIYHQVRD